MPYYRLKTDEEKEAEDTVDGTIEILKQKFAKYNTQ
jgi:hypothetical protein